VATFNKHQGVASSQKAKLVSKSINFSGVLAPLLQQSGVVFPYSPTIQVGYSSSYGAYEIPHSVYQSQYWTNTPNTSISLTATFSANSEKEAIYSAAALHFFRVVTKGDFGQGSKNAGAPPPVLTFSAYGALHFKDVPVVLRSFSYTLPEDIDYISFQDDTLGDVSIPTMWMAQIDLAIQVAPTRQKKFSLGEYTTGGLLKDGGWL
jgi:hypothetical protein